MTERRYVQPPPASAAQVEEMLAAGATGPEVNNALVGAALNDNDWRAVQELCLRLLAGDDQNLAGLAATCLGHLARIHGELDLDQVLPALRAGLQNPVIRGRAETALDDIFLFIPQTPG